MKQTLFAIIFLMSFFGATAHGQAFKFEGFNIILQAPQNHKSATCAVRYAPPTRDIRVTDLNRSTATNLRPCSGSGTNFSQQSGSGATFRANSSTSKWCFEGEDDKYLIEFQGDQFVPSVKYIWPANLKDSELGFYNVRDFGAVGDGRTDDTIAVQSALAYVASKNGGRLRFPEGDYIVGGIQGFEGLAIPSGIIIEGVSGLQTGASTNNVKRSNASRITLRGAGRSLFRIGECVEQVTIRDIELNAETNNRTIGIEGTGAYTTSQGFQFERMAFTNFYRGIQVEGLPQTNLNWQFDYVKVKDSRFIFNTDTGIYINTRNTDWKIVGSLFVNPKATPTQNAFSMHFERVGLVMIEDTYGGGFPGALGGTFINVLDSGNLTIIGSQAENVTKSLEYNAVENPYAGDYSYPITVVNSVFGEPIIFKARRTFVSTGSFYGADTFKANENVRVYSTGDRFCYDGYTLACRGATKNNFDKATVIFMTGQPDEPNVPGHPTYFGTDVEFGKPVKMPSVRQNALPRGKANGSMVYCEDCRRDSTPCRSGGSGAPAMVVSGDWVCL